MFGEKTCLYTIFNREFALRANTRDFVGPFTTSCEARTRVVSKRRADTDVRDTVSGRTQLFLLNVVTDPIRTKYV